ncbi:hypothetical protein EPA93_22440 [Ktedonosporobacter rubrisoli]|uniref:Yip1 domain-containing protein n=1 Tax=Ktedonosporobacter rubrisoli TaxID=2509675 RepID=A0A4V0YZ61_KTERU|nr:Yip1 family protein [Ktedonosporobacter rubrisoli]QBD78601.1 hypothetical protein EPA93_22440 [Ktedonosporobacter rubrisoli]
MKSHIRGITLTYMPENTLSSQLTDREDQILHHEEPEGASLDGEPTKQVAPRPLKALMQAEDDETAEQVGPVQAAAQAEEDAPTERVSVTPVSLKAQSELAIDEVPTVQVSAPQQDNKDRSSAHTDEELTEQRIISQNADREEQESAVERQETNQATEISNEPTQQMAAPPVLPFANAIPELQTTPPPVLVGPQNMVSVNDPTLPMPSSDPDASVQDAPSEPAWSYEDVAEASRGPAQISKNVAEAEQARRRPPSLALALKVLPRQYSYIPVYPKVGTFATEVQYASWGGILAQFILLGLLIESAIVFAPAARPANSILRYMSPFLSGWAIAVAVSVLAICYIAWVGWGVTRLLGGRGSYRDHLYAFLLTFMPLYIALSLFSFCIVLLQALLRHGSILPVNVSSLLAGVLFIYCLILQVPAIRAVHAIKTSRAVAGMLATLMALLFGIVLVGIVSLFILHGRFGA